MRSSSARPAGHSTAKRPFDIEAAIPLLRTAVKEYPRAALFELAGAGYDSVFEVVVACILSVRTLDETTIKTAHALFARARTPAEMAALSEEALDRIIRPCTFHAPKARSIRTIARRALTEFGGTVPCDRDVLLSLPGVGPKCAALVLGIACGQPAVSVDVHVHRIANRWGYVRTKTPEKTMEALQCQLPRDYWVEINALLVPFGKHVCTRVAPRCSTCPLLSMCRQVGVTSRR